jgi:hypothetical protein
MMAMIDKLCVETMIVPKMSAVFSKCGRDLSAFVTCSWTPEPAPEPVLLISVTSLNITTHFGLLGPAFGSDSESDSEPELPEPEFDVVPVLCIPRPLFTVGVWVFFLSLCYYGYP